jgi:lysophospholipase L1-like esterase
MSFVRPVTRSLMRSPARGLMRENGVELLYGVTAANTSRIRAAINAVRAGTGDALWLSPGDSLTASACSASFPLGLRSTARPHYEAVAFAAQLGITVEERALWNLAGKTTTAAYETMVPEWNFVSGTIGTGTSIGGRNFQHAVLSGADVYTPGGTFNKVRLRYTGPTTTRSIVWTASTGASGSIAGDSVFSPKTIILDMAGNATTISFRAGGVASGVNWMGVECYNDTTKRLSVQNGGWNGSDSNDWNNSATLSAPLGMITHVAAHMMLLGLGTNDIQTRTVAAMKTNLQAIVNTQLAVGDCALLGLPPLDPALYTSQSHINTYEVGIEEVAVASGIPFVPYRDILGGTYANSLAAGYSYTDGTHLTALGCEKVANDVIAPLMTSIMAAA